MEPLSEEEKNYIQIIYKHGLGHSVDGSIPNRILCVHNLHWCIETLLRKATKDWNLDYRDGFEKIFKKFINKIPPPKGLDKSILKLNEIRNGIEHRENYPDISVVRKLIPDIEKFINWIIKTTFNTSIDLYSIPLVDEEDIFDDFNKWKDKKLASNFKLTNENLDKFYDYIFICLIPSTYSPNLADMSFDGINQMLSSETKLKVFMSVPNPEHKSKIETYFESFSYLFGSPAQVYTVSTHFRYYNDTQGNEMKVFPDGRIYICYKHRIFDLNKLNYNIENIYSETGSYYIIEEPSKSYGLSLKGYYPKNLEHILKIITFVYHPDCKIKIINIPTNYFRAYFILPLIRFKGKDRILHRSGGIEHIFDSEREYGGDDEDIVFKESFKYDEIHDLTKNFKNWTYGFFRNKSSTHFSRY